MNHIDACKKYRLRKTDICGDYSMSPWRSYTNGKKKCTERRMNYQGDTLRSESSSKQEGLNGKKRKNSPSPVGTHLNRSMLDKGIQTIWNFLNTDEDNSVDLFNMDAYSSLTERGKKKFQKIILPYLLYNAQNVDELKNILFEDEANPSGEFHFKNECHVKRIANENDLCLLAKREENNMQMKKYSPEMLVISRKAFFKIIERECFDKNGLEQKSNVLLRTILQMWKYKDMFFFNNGKNGLLEGYISEGYLTLSDRRKWSKMSFKTGEPLLLREDYHLMEKENVFNDVIHESIILLSKNSRLRCSKEVKDPQEGDPSKGKLKRRKFTQMRCSRREKKCIDPMRILKAFLKKDAKGVAKNKALSELRECTFQPNVRKFVEDQVKREAREKKRQMHIKACADTKVDAKVDAKAEGEDLFKWGGGHITSDVHKHLLEEYSTEHTNAGMEDECVAKYLQMCCLAYGVDMEKESKRSTYKRHDSTRQPTHRESRKIWRSKTPKKSNYPFEATMMGAKKNANVRTLNGKCTWVDGLRGGYISNYFNFSVTDKNSALCGLASCKPDCSRDIRLDGRRLKTKVVPNVDLLNDMLGSPFSNVNCITKGKDDLPEGSLFPSCNSRLVDAKNKIDSDRIINHGGKKKQPPRTNQPFLPLHNSGLTSAKWESRNVRAEVSNQLGGKITAGCSSFAPSDPPKVIAVKWEKSLDDIEKELLCLPQSVRLVQIC
ncbi:conserved Plasmodium protein, unknown function [Plasmodium knowlesi strain H]|uniref:Uncharacterized protein n=3 Tax=Plasmodium knowlesi TaxID=5850 RepID=A0A5K1VDZ5_PLAKH|nr:conserved Plasmodium protein, unknown function [Plasmodium knowlesi strain H]OTN65530.1 Uncharacterized protein PKNOH_S110107000 [Plasmodium knowlesi]CAA9989689.1 conserved Plasmodium protein, unknown function [Plasmodium knowlesi strain H]SBO22838.1 conserved Plasmodium protein, unknown function [Plasmodium knowlesi strain H]SBO23061.1 conserved Plasmodium protein, unknown function [Plasmodium knowlesi strain H]VVS79163.1 conserved Plasmodium protein, unknown function [Plasmodium knowlesi |eukprot:XP_002260413.1 hypothetical protein, conserved in Plasmodium species [Plasmodium knowlesi strain H]